MEFNNTTNFDKEIIYNDKSFDYREMIPMVIVVTIMFVWNLFGNSLAILTFAYKPKLLTKSNIFIVSLAVSDILSALISSPLFIYMLYWGMYDFKLGTFGCRLYFIIDEGTSYCTSVHIASFTVWRFFCIKWPVKIRKLNKRVIQVWVTVLWLVTIAATIWFSFYFSVLKKPKDGSVFSNWSDCSPDIYKLPIFQYVYDILFALFYATPFAITTLSSTLIIYELKFNMKFRTAETQEKQKRAIQQLSLIVILYMIGYLPHSGYRIWSKLTKNKPKLVEHWAKLSTYLLLKFSECMNPVIYVISSGKIKVAAFDTLKTLCCCKKVVAVAPENNTTSKSASAAATKSTTA